MASLSTQVLVIGGGATGLGIAWDAALRGLKVVLIEQFDLAQGTSGRYHGLLHSGGRYVVSDPQSALDCAHENQILRNIAPTTIENTGGLFIATPADPLDYSDRWHAACQKLGVPADELSLSSLNEREPLLNPRIARAFELQDAALDSFDLAHLLKDNIEAAGGQVLLRHRLDRLRREGERTTGAEISDLITGRRFNLDAEVVVNAAGPWAAGVARLARVDLPLSLGKGTMVAMATRIVDTVVNRLKPPSDGDIIVPVGTVCVLGTTDTPVESPDALEIQPWEIDLLIAEGDFMIPGLQSARALRAWAGIRPLYQPGPAQGETRSLPRAHALLDHKEADGVDGLVSIIGGKLTTFRLMAEETVDLICNKLEQEATCTTATTPLAPAASTTLFTLPERLERQSESVSRSDNDHLICECELVNQTQLERAILSDERPSLDDLRRDLRLGMGPCQGAFCAYRAAGIASRIKPSIVSVSFLESFLNERLKGLSPLAWDGGLRQIDFMRRIYLELLGDEHRTNLT
ncbi:MAG: anaerobic glycerol-3-phosphate dehydrogenase subunit GlpA [Anaerolineales bacterium]|nr:anaerobic glycerol-3-phosphate dehydrogenase subunit GlpA [Anaerolineales bacterium]